MAKVSVSWFGHAMFLFERPGIKIVTDPYSTEIGYSFPDIEASVVTISHNHFDHNNVQALKGDPLIIKEPMPLLFGPIQFEGLITNHDDAGGEKRGNNIMFRWQMEGVAFAHMGDYGENTLNDDQKTFLAQTDVLMIPVGGVYTVNAEQARQIIAEIAPKVAIPMHYKTSLLNINIEGIDRFVKSMDNVQYVGETAYFEAGKLPTTSEVWILDLAS